MKEQKVNICGHVYTIQFVDYIRKKDGSIDESTVGENSNDDRLIKIKTTDIAEKQQRATLLHEIIHGILHNSGLAALLNDDDQEEAFVVALENGLMPLMQFKKGAITDKKGEEIDEWE